MSYSVGGEEGEQARRGRRELALLSQRRPPGRPRARLSRRPRHRTVRHHRRAVGTRPPPWASWPQAAPVGRRAGLPGGRPGLAWLPRRAPLAALVLLPAGTSVLVSAQPARLQQAAAPGPLAARRGHGVPG